MSSNKDRATQTGIEDSNSVEGWDAALFTFNDTMNSTDPGPMPNHGQGRFLPSNFMNENYFTQNGSFPNLNYLSTSHYVPEPFDFTQFLSSDNMLPGSSQDPVEVPKPVMAATQHSTCESTIGSIRKDLERIERSLKAMWSEYEKKVKYIDE
jgi:hypothetical protein